MADCIFCKIVDGEIEANKIFENSSAFAFLDANPLVDGHVVVVPKGHVERFSDMDGEAAAGLFDAVQAVHDAILSGLDADGTNIGLNDGKAAGQAIPHTHVHVIPRYSDDGGGSLHSIVQSDDISELEEVQEKLLSSLCR